MVYRIPVYRIFGVRYTVRYFFTVRYGGHDLYDRIILSEGDKEIVAMGSRKKRGGGVKGLSTKEKALVNMSTKTITYFFAASLCHDYIFYQLLGKLSIAQYLEIAAKMSTFYSSNVNRRFYVPKS